MKTKMLSKKIGYWAGVIVIGTVLGLALQFAKAWTEPTVAPPNENVGAPINTGGNLQNKTGSFTTNGAVIADIAVKSPWLCIGSGNDYDCRNVWPGGGTSTTLPTCTSFTYTLWGPCYENGSSGFKTRNVESTVPENCTGGDSLVSKTCTPQYDCPKIDSYYYGGGSIYYINGKSSQKEYVEICMPYPYYSCSTIKNPFYDYSSTCEGQTSKEKKCTWYSLEMCSSTDPASCGPWKTVTEHTENCRINLTPIQD